MSEKSGINFAPLLAVLAALGAALDYTVRNSNSAWTELAVAQWAVTLSPMIYVALLAALALKLSALPAKLSPLVMKIMAIALCACAIAVIVQQRTGARNVGSAYYAVVRPLFASGVPLAVLTFIVYFSKSRGQKASTAFSVISVLWVVMPIGIDTMYLTQGGYRGQVELDSVAVLGTSYNFVTALAAYGIFFGLIATPVLFFRGIYLALRSPQSDKLRHVAMSLSLLALSMQFVNWGEFVWD
jgi:hypothetical protein